MHTDYLTGEELSLACRRYWWLYLLKNIFIKMAQGLGHIKLQDRKILVLVRQGKTTWSYKLRNSGKEGFEVMDNDFLVSPEGKEHLDKIINGQSVTL